MVKTEYRKSGEGVEISMKGNLFSVMAEEMLCIEKFYEAVQDHDKKMGHSFRAMVLAWARGDFDD